MPTVAANGQTLAYESLGAGHPLVLITGVGYGGWFWHTLAPRLAEHFEAITFDNRGSGGSDKPEGPYTTAMLAADTLGLMDALGLARAHVLGHSLGGFIAQEVALAQPGRVDRLILAATTFGGTNVIPITPEALKVMTDRSGDPADLVRRGIDIASATGFAEANPAIVQELLAYRMTNPVPPAQYSAQVMAGALHNAEARIGSLTCPTLILFGAEDRVVPPGNAELLAAKIPGAQVAVLPGTGHIFPIEAPERTAELIREFLEG